ncbi:hypothetical protein K2173_001534 [Erythroxylum novogranatense]|uniref:CCHC-type domain-containing protein n=1 Tax=Erythroxylum novogranatense TaxID=1862640 RepID=A0AAV8T595_9ROSI|nr:hypothetical protein K2173_001534 [Erythroxylum novogranatense]
MRIGVQNKIGYLTVEIMKPAPNDLGYVAWVTDNNKVKSWLIDSMSPYLMQRFIRLAIAKEKWEAIAKTFYYGSVETQLFELNKKSFTTKQNGQPLSTYYNELVAIFQEIDHRTVTNKEGVAGIVHMHSMTARLRVHIFLSGLDVEFDQICGEILRKDPKLDLESTYAYVRRDAQQRQTIGNSRPVLEKKTNNFICSHCGETGHSKQQCYKIIGYLDWWDFSKKLRKNINGKATMFDISTANGSISPITGEGPVVLSNNLTLDTILARPGGTARDNLPPLIS